MKNYVVKKKAYEELKILNEIKFINQTSNGNSNSNNNTIFCLFGELNYVEKYYFDTKRSILKYNETARIHLHVMLDEKDDFVKMNHLLNISDEITYSYEFYRPKTKAGYTTRRFVRLLQLYDRFSSPIIALDIDSVITGKFDKYIKEAIQSDVQIYLREYDFYINQRVHAGFIFINGSENSKYFLIFLVNYFCQLEKLGKLMWFCDQMGLLAAYNYFESKSLIKIQKIKNEYMTWDEINKDSLVMTLKGELKNL